MIDDINSITKCFQMEICFANLKKTEFQFFLLKTRLDLMKNISASKNWKLKIEFSVFILKTGFAWLIVFYIQIFIRELDIKLNWKLVRVWKVSFDFQFKIEIKIDKNVNLDICLNIEFSILTLKLNARLKFLDWKANFEITYFHFSFFILRWILHGQKSII